jgi:GTPase involved in cell partitioning and DNA repair
VSLVGYTNAGKSTLFNALTKAGAYAADQLFATLDTTSRRLFLGDAGNIVISDTVGFIRDLPHSLVAAFHATLEETVSADLLLHVVDSPAMTGKGRSQLSTAFSMRSEPVTFDKSRYGTRLTLPWRVRRFRGMRMVISRAFCSAPLRAKGLICCGRILQTWL